MTPSQAVLFNYIKEKHARITRHNSLLYRGEVYVSVTKKEVAIRDLGLITRQLYVKGLIKIIRKSKTTYYRLS